MASQEAPHLLHRNRKKKTTKKGGGSCKIGPLFLIKNGRDPLKNLHKNRTKLRAKNRPQKAILSKKPTMAIDALLMRSKRLTWFCGMVVLKNGDLKKSSNDGAYRGAKMTF